MTFTNVYLNAFILIMVLMTALWIISVMLKNVSIVDLFWGLGFVMVNGYYFLNSDGFELRKLIVLALVSIWGLRLSGYLMWRNIGKGEDFRYSHFRQEYGEHRYWWISFFQTFLLQGVLMWLISAPLLAAQFYGENNTLGIIDVCGVLFWTLGFIFETTGDYQMARFKADISNKGKVMNKGLWKFTRHPNYFGDSSVWWGYGLLCLGAGSFVPVLGSVLMTATIIKVSGVALLEKSLNEKKPEYRQYVENTSAFIPWFPKNSG